MSRCSGCGGRGWTVYGGDPWSQPSYDQCGACDGAGSLSDAAGLAGQEGCALLDAAGFGSLGGSVAMGVRVGTGNLRDMGNNFRVFLDWPENAAGWRDREAVYRATASGSGMEPVCLETSDARDVVALATSLRCAVNPGNASGAFPDPVTRASSNPFAAPGEAGLAWHLDRGADMPGQPLMLVHPAKALGQAYVAWRDSTCERISASAARACQPYDPSVRNSFG